MTNADNPFITLAKIIRTQAELNNPTTFFIGKIIGANPIVVEVAGIVLKQNEILINEKLVDSHAVDDDVLMLMSNDKQRFVMVCKVV
ncbi:MAG: hypothetical protein BEN18_10255 [Epulopiscium sp. Nuni2H_MBin001]|nr:MAG: hypothetical protein BEN18_10255 [Epulopiscium sp. Nuni2H_MBin001]